MVAWVRERCPPSLPISWSWPSILPAPVLGEVGPEICLVSAVELTLSTGMLMNLPKNLSMRNLDSVPNLPCSRMGWGEMPSYPAIPPLPLAATAGERASPEIIRGEELTLSFTSCCTWESGVSISSGQHSRASPEGVSMAELTLRLKQENCSHPLLVTLQEMS